MVALNTVASGERLAARLTGRIRDRKVLAAMRGVLREHFLDDSMAAYAADEVALPIGYEQTTSNPFIIARMLEMAVVAAPPPAKVLEVGVGSGYQTALLAELGYNVVGVERIRGLQEAARKRLRRLGYDDIRLFHGDGWNGWSAAAPYDAMIVCAESPCVPVQLLSQLTANGLLVLPLMQKTGVRITAVNASGDIVSRREAVAFVPMKEGLLK